MRLEDMIAEELCRASTDYPAFHSCHEGLAVLEEEVTELRALVHENKGCAPQDASIRKAMLLECIQIAAMAMRYAGDLCDASD